ncbi:hypothetical protein M8494_30300 [Serratia ureilytica]
MLVLLEALPPIAPPAASVKTPPQGMTARLVWDAAEGRPMSKARPLVVAAMAVGLMR